MTPPSRRANQADIASRLGVSVSTVSRALANEMGISETVRREVHKVARSIDYKSKHVPLPGSADKRAVALVPLGGAMGGLASFYFGIVEGMRSQAAEDGMMLDVRLVNESSVTLDLVRKQISNFGAAGILLAGIDPWDELIGWCAEADIAAVLVNGSDPQMRVSSVSPANFYGAYMATQALIDAGHRKILHYTYRHRPTIRQRQRGFEAAIAATPDARGTIVTVAEQTSQELLADLVAGKHDVTAVFCWNDIAAVQLLEGLYGGDARLPGHLSIVGFDDLPVAGVATPRLTTVRVEREAIGRSAVRLLGHHLDGEAAVQQMEIGVSLVAGETILQI